MPKQSAQSKIGVGFIGANPAYGWGGAVHIPAIRLVPEFSLAAVCNTSMDNASAAAKSFGAPQAFCDPSALAASPEVDLVVVCVRAPNHYPLVKAALEAGKPVYCEWPLGRTTDEAEALAALAKSKGVANFVGLQSRATPVVNYMRDLVGQGYVGRILSCSMLGSATTWGAVVDPRYRATTDANQGITLLRVSGAHALDLLLYCLGEFRELSAFIATRRDQVALAGSAEMISQSSPDQVLVQGRLQSGAMASFHMRGGMAAGTGQLFEVNGTEGDLILSTPELSALQNSDCVLKGSQRGAAMEILPVPGRYRMIGGVAPSSRIANVAELYARIARSLTGGLQLAPDFELAVTRHHTLDAIRRADHSGQRQFIGQAPGSSIHS